LFKTSGSEYHELLQRGVFLSYECNYAMSVQCYSRAIQLDPNCFRAYFHRGNDYINWKKDTRALADFEYLDAHFSDQLPPSLVHLIKGTIIELKGNAQGALEEYQRSLECDPDNYYTNFIVGYIQCQQEKYEAALEHYNKALKKPIYSTCMVLNNIGWVYQCQNKFEEAKQYYEKSLEAYPRCLIALSNLAMLYIEKLNDYDKALELYQTRMMELDMFHTPVLIGNVYFYDKNEPENSVPYYRKALSLDPTNAEAYAMLANYDLEKGLESWLLHADIPKAKRHFERVFDVLNNGMNAVIDMEELKYLQTAKKAVKDSLEQRGLYDNTLDKFPLNFKWSHPRNRVQFFQQLYRLLLHCNDELESRDFSFYVYRWTENTAGIEKAREFADVKIIVY
jgi:tetratricopeptide (TPR) repeat protein